MEEKELLLEVLDHYGSISPGAITILKILVQVAVDDVAIIKITELTRLSKLAQNTVYTNLAKLEKEKFLERISKKGSKLGAYKIKPLRFEDLIQRYKLQKNVIV